MKPLSATHCSHGTTQELPNWHTESLALDVPVNNVVELLLFTALTLNVDEPQGNVQTGDGAHQNGPTAFSYSALFT